MKVEGVGLVLEGGGMRCVFSAGVLDYFMDHDIEFPYVAGVSGGACTALCYLAKQPRRQKQCFIDLYEKYHYIGIKNFITKRNFFDLDMVVEEFGTTIIPFDFETYFNNPIECEVVASNCLTGEADYFDERKSPKRLMQIAKASCSVPVVTRKQYVDGVPYLDGGISDPVPLFRAISKGYKRNVVVLTRNAGRRSPFTNIPIPPGIFGREITKKMRYRGRDYNNLMKVIEEKAASGEVLVIQPQKKLKVSAVERNIDRLRELYEEGYECAKAIHAYLGI
ncbi:MAG: patatin family protein [Paludibacteraceae bacterium]|nr:patatin family protein [Paludibacteraceae bacterium]